MGRTSAIGMEVYEAIFRGDFYASTGINVRSIRRVRTRLVVDTVDAG